MDRLEERCGSGLQGTAPGIDEMAERLQTQIKELSSNLQCNFDRMQQKMRALDVSCEDNASALRRQLRETQYAQETAKKIECQANDIGYRLQTCENSARSAESAVRHLESVVAQRYTNKDGPASDQRIQELESHVSRLVEHVGALRHQVEHMGQMDLHLCQRLESASTKQDSQAAAFMCEVNALRQRLDSIDIWGQSLLTQHQPSFMNNGSSRHGAYVIPGVVPHSTQSSTLQAEMASVTSHVQSLIQDVIDLVPRSNFGR